MESEGRVSHEQIIDRVGFVARLAWGVLASVVVLAASTFGSCLATRDLVYKHETQIDGHEKEIEALRMTDRKVEESLRSIHGSVERIAGALGVRGEGR